MSEKNNFCPSCGTKQTDYNNEDWGMLGKNDFTSQEPEIKLPMGFNMIFNTLMKSLDKQFQELDKEMRNETRIINSEKKIALPTCFAESIDIFLYSSGVRCFFSSSALARLR